MNRTNLHSTELLQSVMMASPNGVLILQAIRGSNGQIIDLYMTMINAVAEQELDCPAVEALGQSFADAFPHLAEKNLLETYRQVLDTGQSAQFEVHYFRPPQAKLIWLAVSVVRLEKNLLITFADITETKMEVGEAAMTDTMQLVFDESVNGISIFNAIRDEHGQISDFRLMMVNEAGLRMTGYQRDDVVGRTIWEMYPATSINGLFKQYVRACETNQIIQVEHYYPEYDIWREGKIVPIPEGIMVTYNDTTAIKKAQEKVNQQARLLDAVLDYIPTGVAVVEPLWSDRGAPVRIVDFQIVQANSALEQVIGQPASQLVGQSLTHAFPDAETLLRHCREGIEEGSTQAFDLQLSQQPYRVSATAKGDQLLLAFTKLN
ncbi:PAS domain-containing protein [Spirosoma radiotolerans]|uniref:PAS domain-containing protein n=1 Tax=Spirosoma radiotolerans TaxID=1379870 RepID=A0A0E3V670_9BACT|nr:PAS domain-containing protein [Spirosoma radiotolerans]AKD54772.1 hypothetical protein SD10_07485 [Spirosoma radiotolerans]